MEQNRVFSAQELRYLTLLSKQYPTIQATATEIMRLRAILNLPKGTEHFMSDIHGEYEAFLHILNSCSGEVKVKLRELFAGVLTDGEVDELATLIYYPRAKLAQMSGREDLDGWYRRTLHRLVDMSYYVSDKYTRYKVRNHIPQRYRDVIEELLSCRMTDGYRQDYYENILQTILDVGQAPAVICTTQPNW